VFCGISNNNNNNNNNNNIKFTSTSYSFCLLTATAKRPTTNIDQVRSVQQRKVKTISAWTKKNRQEAEYYN